MKSEVVKAVSEAVARIRSTPIGKTPMSRRTRAGGGKKDKSSFAYKKCETVYLFVYGGRVTQNGKASKTILENDTENKVSINGGTSTSPGYVSIRVATATGPSSAVLVFTTTEPESDGTFLYKVLCEAYLSDAGKAVWKKDRRPDWDLSNSIGGA